MLGFSDKNSAVVDSLRQVARSTFFHRFLKLGSVLFIKSKFLFNKHSLVNVNVSLFTSFILTENL